MEETQRKLDFIKNVLPNLIIESSDDLKNCSVVSCSANDDTKTDGFMSAIFKVDLVLKDENLSPTNLNLMVKLMKGDDEFRETTGTDTLCWNEVHIYKNVLPAYKNFLKEQGSTLNIDEWIPKIYYADFKIFPELNEAQKEAVIVMENLQPRNYRLGPRIDLDELHLRTMIEAIAKFHAICYAMKIENDPTLQPLIDNLKPFNFKDEKNPGTMAQFFHQTAWKRIFKALEHDELKNHLEFTLKLKIFKEKYWENFADLMQSFLKKENVFTVMLHGDYNRNNVLFQYDSLERVSHMKMIDFQETRYATSAIDLAFFMYMNMPSTIREELWDKLLENYHETLISTISSILKCDISDTRLESYKFENFLEHFSKFAYYGAMISIQFIPWMACSEEECKIMSDYFEKDMYNEGGVKLVMTCGGRDVDDRVLSVAFHAFKKGYMRFMDN